MYSSLRSIPLQASSLSANSCRKKFTWPGSRTQVQFLACSLKSDHTCASKLNFMVLASLFQLPLLLSHHPSMSVYHTMPTLLHQWCPTQCLGLPCFSTLTILSNYEKYNFSFAVFILEGLRITENVIHFRKLFVKNTEFIFWTSWPWSYVLIILRVVLPGRTHSSNMPDKWGVILLIFPTTELITPLS